VRGAAAADFRFDETKHLSELEENEAKDGGCYGFERSFHGFCLL